MLAERGVDQRQEVYLFFFILIIILFYSLKFIFNVKTLVELELNLETVNKNKIKEIKIEEKLISKI